MTGIDVYLSARTNIQQHPPIHDAINHMHAYIITEIMIFIEYHINHHALTSYWYKNTTATTTRDSSAR